MTIKQEIQINDLHLRVLDLQKQVKRIEKDRIHDMMHIAASNGDKKFYKKLVERLREGKTCT